MNRKKIFSITIILSLITLLVYLFISAPVPLQKKTDVEAKAYSVEDGFDVLAKINDITRTFYTKNIVGEGKKVGLKFDENWKDEDVEAGPLPALFLREISGIIEKSPVELGLYLGSDFPISKANLFKGIQAEKFQEIKKDKKPKFFFDDDTKRYVGMFPDFASAGACVSCHNDHKDSPKKDWQLNNVMGATTWSYANDSLTTNELLEWIKIYRKGAINTFELYLDEVNNFNTTEKPEIGSLWPSGGGYHLPTKSVMKDTLTKLTAKELLTRILKEEDEK